MAFSNDQLQDAIAVANIHIRNDITSQLEKTNYLYKLMVDNKEYVDGGTQIQQPINHKSNQSKGFINGISDVIDTNTNQQLTYGRFDWKYYYQNVSLTLDDFVKTHQSKEAIKSLVDAKRTAAIADTTRDLTESMHGAGTDSDGKAFNGFADIFAASGTSYGGLLDTDFDDPDTWLTEINSTDTSASYPVISRLISQLKARGNQYGGGAMNKFRPDVMISNFAVQDKFMSTLQAQQRFQDKTTMKAGFDGVEVNGLFWYIDDFTSGSADGTTADNFLYIISSGTMKLCYKYGWGKTSPFDNDVQLPNQPIKSSQMYFAGNMLNTCRRVNGVFKTLVA